MIEFLRLLASSDISFLRYALLAGLLTGVPLAIIGFLYYDRPHLLSRGIHSACLDVWRRHRPFYQTLLWLDMDDADVGGAYF